MFPDTNWHSLCFAFHGKVDLFFWSGDFCEAYLKLCRWSLASLGSYDLVGGFKYFLFSPLPGKDSHLDGLKPPTSYDDSELQSS